MSEILVAATLLQSVAFSMFLLTERFRGSLANRMLLIALVLMAAVKADQLYQFSGGLGSHPEWGFVLAPLQPLLTPALFLFVLARTNSAFRLRPKHAAHLIPGAAYLVYLSAAYFRLDLDAKRALIQSGGLSAPLHAFIVPALSDLTQIAYIAASLVVLARYGLRLSCWFSRINDKELAWLKQLLIAWAAVFIVHFAWSAASGLFHLTQFAAAAMLTLNAAHFAFINILLMLAIVDYASGRNEAPRPKYASSSQTAAERAALFQRAEAALAERRLFLDPDLTLRDLADHLGATPRDLSEAINGAGDDTFFSVVNKARIEFAKSQLRADRRARILDIALASGFNSKSAFNEAFRKYAGETPSAWRAAAPDARVTLQPQAAAQ